MAKKLLLVLPDAVHEALKEHQMDRITKERTITSLNDLLVEIISTATNKKEPIVERVE